MLFEISPIKAWSYALGLFTLDYLLIISFIGAAPAESIDQSTWDFRITELRVIEAEPQTAVAGVSISRESKSTEVETESNGNSSKNPLDNFTISAKPSTQLQPLYPLPF